jgi:hypothetical protein
MVMTRSALTSSWVVIALALTRVKLMLRSANVVTHGLGPVALSRAAAAMLRPAMWVQTNSRQRPDGRESAR